MVCDSRCKVDSRTMIPWMLWFRPCGRDNHIECPYRASVTDSTVNGLATGGICTSSLAHAYLCTCLLVQVAPQSHVLSCSDCRGQACSRQERETGTETDGLDPMVTGVAMVAQGRSQRYKSIPRASAAGRACVQLSLWVLLPPLLLTTTSTPTTTTRLSQVL